MSQVRHRSRGAGGPPSATSSKSSGVAACSHLPVNTGEHIFTLLSTGVHPDVAGRERRRYAARSMGSRANGTNPRALGTNPRAVRARGGDVLKEGSCGVLTKKGTPCRWPRAECPIRGHAMRQQYALTPGQEGREGGLVAGEYSRSTGFR